MSFHTDTEPTDNGTMPAIHLSPAEIAAAIVPALIGMAAVALVAVLMLL